MAVEHIEKQVPIDPSLFSKGADYLLKVVGMSMRDAGILDGDYLAVRKTSEVRNGDIVVARLDDEAPLGIFQLPSPRAYSSDVCRLCERH
jgi:repressor LexA